ncbi:MAG: diacylglycerol/lipid kinase family protein [Bacteroidales bacterium]
MPRVQKPALEDWFVVVNPHAGLSKCSHDWPLIERLLREADFSFSYTQTTHREHAISITTTAVKKGYRKFIVVGGDGTLNEVVNGLFRQKTIPLSEFTVGLVPVGTGNDWRRSFGISDDYHNAIATLVKGNILWQDVGHITYQNARGPKSRYFVNVAGMGYDAVVARKTNIQKDKGKGGPLSYLANLFTSLIYYHHTQVKITADGVPLETDAFSLSVGIGQYNGGGMRQLPFAHPADGILDMTLIQKIGKLTVLKEVKNLYDGSFIRHPKVKTLKAAEFIIESNPTIELEADGESLGHSPFRIKIIPSALQVIGESMVLPAQF